MDIYNVLGVVFFLFINDTVRAISAGYLCWGAPTAICTPCKHKNGCGHIQHPEQKWLRTLQYHMNKNIYPNKNGCGHIQPPEQKWLRTYMGSTYNILYTVQTQNMNADMYKIQNKNGRTYTIS